MHGGDIDPLGLPQFEEAVAGGVAPDRGHVGHARALPRRRYGGVGGVAAGAFQVQPASVGADRLLVELQHRLAHADQVDRHGRIACAAAWMASRSPAAMRRSSTSAPPMPTKAAPAAR